MSTPTSRLLINKKKSSIKAPRVVYSDHDSHMLVDIVQKYSRIVECKMTDATTWKDKVEVWDKITLEYNCRAIAPRSVEQLRMKFDNLKKDVRKYYAKQRQQLYQTGGGVVEDQIRGILKLLYEKILGIIGVSVMGTEPHPSDSDGKVTVATTELKISAVAGCSSDDAMGMQVISEDSLVQEVDPQDILYLDPAATNIQKPQTTQADADATPKADPVTTWDYYTPSMLRTKKHPNLQTKKFKEMLKKKSIPYKSISAPATKYQELAVAKKELASLKKQLLEKEATQSDELHRLRMQKEEELYNLRIEGQKLKNEKIQLDINKLKNS